MVECQLPKLDVAGSTPVSRSIFSITWERSATSSTPFHSVKRLERLFPSCSAASARLDRAALRININRHADAMPALVGRDLRIDPGLVAETGMGPPQHLKICPAKTDRLRAWASCAGTRRYPSTWALPGSPKRIPTPSGLSPTSSIHSFSCLAVFGGMATVRRETWSSACRCRPGRGAAR